MFPTPSFFVQLASSSPRRLHDPSHPSVYILIRSSTVLPLRGEPTLLNYTHTHTFKRITMMHLTQWSMISLPPDIELPCLYDMHPPPYTHPHTLYINLHIDSPTTIDLDCMRLVIRILPQSYVFFDRYPLSLSPPPPLLAFMWCF